MVRIENGEILIKANLETGWEYPIAIDRLSEMDWLKHLKEKNWFTPEIESEFIRVTKEIYGERKDGQY